MMTDWRVAPTICGLEELCDHAGSGVTHLLSILDPGTPEPADFDAAPPRRRLTLRFHDIIVPTPGQVMPARADVEAVLAFGRALPGGDPARLLVHCHMGISRSTAAATTLVAQAHPEMDEEEVFAGIDRARGKAWPNLAMIRFADDLLGRDGRLVAAAGRQYRRQLERHPRVAEFFEQNGRAEEVEMARAAG